MSYIYKIADHSRATAGHTCRWGTILPRLRGNSMLSPLPENILPHSPPQLQYQRKVGFGRKPPLSSHVLFVASLQRGTAGSSGPHFALSSSLRQR